MNSIIRLFSTLILCGMLAFASYSIAYAESFSKDFSSNAIVFLLDSSNSMNSNDEKGLAPDFIREVSRGLPYNWNIAFIFNAQGKNH